VKSGFQMQNSSNAGSGTPRAIGRVEGSQQEFPVDHTFGTF